MLSHQYHILPRLEALGLVAQVQEAKSLEYMATSPDVLLELVQKRTESLIATRRDLRKVIKQIEPQINTAHDKPMVRYFYGREGIKRAYRSFLDHAQEKAWHGVVNRPADPEFLEWLEDMIIAERVKKNIFLNLIITDHASGARLTKHKREEKREVKIVKTNNFPTGTYIIIDGSRILLFTQQSQEEDTVGMIIDHPGVARGFKAIFDLLWE